MAPTLHDLHPDILQTHILCHLDGPSLSATAAASSRLNTLCSDHRLWSQITTTTWPSITHPRLHQLISTFPAGHRSFFDDSFPPLTTTINHHHLRRSWSTPKTNYYLSHTLPSELISAVDIRYQTDIIYSKVKFMEITSDFLSSGLRIELNKYEDSMANRPGFIDLTVDEIAGADVATVSHLKNSLTLNWILIDPARKRACNLSSIKPVSARRDWVTNETHLRYVTVLPGCDPNDIVQCRIHLLLGVGEKGVGLFVKEVLLKFQDLDSVSLNGMEFLKVIIGAIMEENNVTRKIGDNEQRWRSYMVFKEMKKEKKELEKKKERKRALIIYFKYFFIFVCFFFYTNYLFLLLK